MVKITNNNRKVYNKKTKAFTLAELLAVITILGVIALIVFQVVNKAIKNSKEKSYNQYTYQYNETSCDDMPVERICDTEIMGRNITTGEVVCLDPDMNPRYVGSDPDNYVEFNGELWRIIGKFDGQVKIIRDEYDKAVSIWGHNNNWDTASLQQELNGTYLSNIQTNDSISYSYIDLNHVWNLGAISSDDDNWTREKLYNSERGDVPAGASGSKVTWTGAIALMYPSDYGYSTSGDISTCGNSDLFSWSDYSECYNNSWMIDDIPNLLSYRIISFDGGAYNPDDTTDKFQWTLTSFSDTGLVVQIYHVGNSDSNCVRASLDLTYCLGSILPSPLGYLDGTAFYSARPSLYLKSSVIITGGTGSSDDPYVLKIQK